MTETAGYQMAVTELMILYFGSTTVREPASTKFQPARFLVARLRQDMAFWTPLYTELASQNRGRGGEIIGGRHDK